MLKKIHVLLLLVFCCLSVRVCAAPEITVNSVSFTNENGNTITSISSNAVAEVNASVTSNTDNQQVTLVVALTNAGGELAGFQTTSVIIAKGQTKMLTAGIVIPGDNDVYHDYTLKAYLWQDFYTGYSLYDNEIVLN